MSTQTIINNFDLITPIFTKNNISFIEALYELEEYFAQGYEEFDLASCLTGEIVNDYDFIINSPIGSESYKLNDIFELIPYFKHFTSIICPRLIDIPVWEKA